MIYILVTFLLISSSFVSSDEAVDGGNDENIFDDILNSLLGNDKEQSTVVSVTETPASTTTPLSTQSSTNSGTTVSSSRSASEEGKTTQSDKATSPATTSPTSTLHLKTYPRTDKTITEDPNCATREPLSKICNIHISNLMEDANIWDVYYMLFNDAVLDSLLYCPRGTWCLKDELDTYKEDLMKNVEGIRNSDAFSYVCDNTFLQCLQEVRNQFGSCDVSPSINFTESAVSLLCSLPDRKKFDVDCLEQLLISWHVSIMGIIENDFDKADQQSSENACKQAEDLMIETFLNTKSMCPTIADKLSTFEPWKWFMPDVTLTQKKCGFSDNSAMIDDGGIIPPETSTDTPGSEKQTHQDQISEFQEDDTKMMVGASVGAIFTFLVLVTLAIVFWRRHKMDESDKEGYKPLISHGP